MMDLKELKRLAAAAPPGPWRATQNYVVAEETEDRLGFRLSTRNFNGSREDGRKFGAYIAAANPATVLALIARIAELEAAAASMPEYEVDPMEVVRTLVCVADEIAAMPEERRKVCPSPPVQALTADDRGQKCVRGARLHRRRFGDREPAARWCIVTGDQFYLQDSRYYVGNDMMFWAVNGKGYTTDMRKAEVYTKAEAVARHQARETDIPWPKDYIDARTRPAVDMQYVKRNEALAGTGIVLVEPKRYRPQRAKCQGCAKFIRDIDQYHDCPHCGADNRP